MEGDSLSLWFRLAFDGPPSCFLQSKSCSVNRCQKLGIDWWNDTLSAIGVHEDFLYLDASSSHHIHSKNTRNGGLFLWISIDWLDDCFTIPVLILLALQSDLGTALVFVAIFSGMVLLFGCFCGRLSFGFSTGVTAVVGFMAIFISKDGRAFLHQIECQPTRLTVFWPGSIPLTLRKQRLTNRRRDKLRLEVVACLGKVSMCPISSFST